MDERLTICNMSIEGGARCGYVNPDAATVEYLRGRPYAPKDTAFDRAAAWWKSVATEPDAKFDDVARLDGAAIEPVVTWGINPGMSLGMNDDKLQGREMSASSSNRNFIGRQGSPTGRTLLMSPAMVVAAAITGAVTDVREILK